MHREKKSIIINILLFGLPSCGRNTFLQWIVENENLLDANFMKAIQQELESVRTQINDYMRSLKNLPSIVKMELQNLIDSEKYEEVMRCFSEYRGEIQESVRNFDLELSEVVDGTIKKLQTYDEEVEARTQTFSYLDIAGTAQITYRIHYYNYSVPTPFELSNFLTVIDGIIFIWDSQLEINKNLEIFELLLNNLVPGAQIPLIIALNKVDLPHNINTTDIHQLLSQAKYEAKLQTTLFSDAVFHELTIFETIATQGVNLKHLINNIKRMIVLKNTAEIARLQSLTLQEVEQ